MFSMELLVKNIQTCALCKNGILNAAARHMHPAFTIQISGLKYFPPPPNYKDIQMPERPKLRFMDKVPQMPSNMKAPKMQKKLIFMRGPEEIHNFLVHKQHGIVALTGGRLRYGHFEMVRLTLGRKMDTRRMFAEWRVDAPWQPVTKKGQGQRMGGGKGAIDHYVTPVKAGRIIVEIAGVCEFDEVRPMLENVAEKLPFAAKAVTYELMLQEQEEEKMKEKLNMNPFTFEYIIRNKMGGSSNWMSPYDRKWFGKYR